MDIFSPRLGNPRAEEPQDWEAPRRRSQDFSPTQKGPSRACSCCFSSGEWSLPKLWRMWPKNSFPTFVSWFWRDLSFCRSKVTGEVFYCQLSRLISDTRAWVMRVASLTELDFCINHAWCISVYKMYINLYAKSCTWRLWRQNNSFGIESSNAVGRLLTKMKASCSIIDPKQWAF